MATNTSEFKESSFEQFAKEHTSEFGKIRNVMKEEGNMFLFGEPTPQMFYFMIKLYHEYIAKLAYCEANPTSTICGDTKCMIGILQTSDGQIYVTISEDPREDSKYFAKRDLLLSIMHNANMNVEYPREDDIDRSALQSNREVYNISKGNSIPSQNIKKWRGGSNPAAPFNDPKYIPYLLTTATDESDMPFDYDERLRDKITVNYVDSWRYMHERRKGKSFVPFKKYEGYPASRLYEILCNNGSTCTESKLFGYYHNNLKPKGLGVVSFAAYWIGNDYPPNHHMKSYGYTPGIDDEMLNNLRVRCLEYAEALMKDNFQRNYRDKFDAIINNVVQPLALACPGCLANKQKYISGEIEQWNYASCRKKRTSKAMPGGARRRKTLRKKNRRHSRKH